MTMSSLVIPKTGLTIGGPSKSPSKATAIGLTLSDAVIEEMIRCVQNGNPIQLSLGDTPSISYGLKTQHLGHPTDSSTHEVFRTNSQSSVQPRSKLSIPHPAPNTFSGAKLTSTFVTLVDKKLTPTGAPEIRNEEPISSIPSGKKSKRTDAALAALQSSLATESLKKAENTVKYIKDGSLPIPGKRGTGKMANKPNYLALSRQGNDANKSLAISPSPTSASVPLSQQQAEHAKAARKPVIHLLAVAPLTEVALQAKVPGSTAHDLKQALQKVGDLNSTTGKWELRKTFYKELDVWSFRYESASDRQQAIDNAVKIFDKMRLNVSEPEWEKLLARNERGTGKCLSKLQAQIAQASSQKAPKASESGKESPCEARDDLNSGDKANGKAKSESMARTGALGSSTRPKKSSEKEAQAKRLLSKKPLSSKPPSTKATTTKKATTSRKSQSQARSARTDSKAISSEYVQSSDEDEQDTPSVDLKVSKPNKRAREVDEIESTTHNLPASKKPRKDVSKNHRVSDASQTSRTTTTSVFSNLSGKSLKSNSPRKSSPLASSPPTNASDIEQSTGSQISSSASPPHPDSGARPATSNSTKTSTASSRRLRPEVTDLARKYKMFYPKYLDLHRRLTGMGDRRDRELEKDLLDMHARLDSMKREIFAGIVDLNGG